MKYVISLGGSIINPGQINIPLLKELKSIITKSKHEFVIVCGGGKVARDYIKAGLEFNVPSVRLDEVGIKATELNAELVSAIMGVRRAGTLEQAVTERKITVTNGLFPGLTTDFDAVTIADLVRADAVINISNVQGIYDKDPKNKDAKLLKELTYKKLISLANEFELGLGANFIFDLAASKLASRTKIKIICLQGLDNLNKFLSNKSFNGSVVQ
ncbi:MAG: UMP kinase [Candidatus Nanoarchaeia archaeon]